MIATSYLWQFRASTGLIRILLTVYTLALIACFLNSIDLKIQLGLAVTLLLHCYVTIKKFIKENWQLNYNDENGWQLSEFNISHTLEILPSTVVTRRFIFLHYQGDGKKNYRVIAKDALLQNYNDYRQLIVTLTS